MSIRMATESDLPAVLDIHRRAFGQETEANLVREILTDPSARPALSLLAAGGGRPLGHVLFTAAHLSPPDRDVSAVLLAPLAVLPEGQGKGLGSRLIEAGLARLTGQAVDLVFVLGDPQFYGRFGFAPASPLGLAAPFPLPNAYADAWRVKTLQENLPGRFDARVTCCDALNRPELWQD